MFRELGFVSSSTPIATTAHSSQVVADSEVVMESHDSDYIATELELIATRTEHPQPKEVDWAKVRPDQFADIPFLSALRDTIERGNGAAMTDQDPEGLSKLGLRSGEARVCAAGAHLR
jgi:5-formyltetrahydrofolate cyclo-ligase